MRMQFVLPLYVQLVLLVLLAWMLSPGTVCVALLNQPLLLYVLLWLLWDVVYLSTLMVCLLLWLAVLSP